MTVQTGELRSDYTAICQDYAAIRQDYSAIRQDLQEIIRMFGGRGHNQDDQHWDRRKEEEGERGDERHEVQPSGERRVDLPVFEGFDAMGWIARAETVFETQGVKEEEKVRRAAISMEGSAGYWFRAWKEKAKNRSWNGLKEALVIRFGTIVERLAASKQKGTVDKSTSRFWQVEGQKTSHLGDECEEPTTVS
ncbi:uncharacterized protein LOC124830654 [Vigna umbellata]|uniref:uncharacterized protein LOC124830654 n=1 Tax=Vigna umbellata TaxID=87088 RepID=UPI001F5FC24C|nr:uncharacterized protein LOC124830654 [Vigna umbellata]